MAWLLVFFFFFFAFCLVGEYLRSCVDRLQLWRHGRVRAAQQQQQHSNKERDGSAIVPGALEGACVQPWNWDGLLYRPSRAAWPQLAERQLDCAPSGPLLSSLPPSRRRLSESLLPLPDLGFGVLVSLATTGLGPRGGWAQGCLLYLPLWGFPSDRRLPQGSMLTIPTLQILVAR